MEKEDTIRHEQFFMDIWIADRKVQGHVTHFLDSQFPAVPDFRVKVESEYRDKVFTYYLAKGAFPLFWFPISPPEVPDYNSMVKHDRLVFVNECISGAIIEQVLKK